MMVNYKDNEGTYETDPKELNVMICKLLAFCRINKGNRQVAKLKKHLLRLETTVAAGIFKN